MSKVVNFLFEAAVLKRLQRTGWQTLGGNQESVAGHVYMVCVISYVLAKKLHADIEKTLVTALFHDSNESRVGEIQKISDLYLEVDEKRANRDLFDSHDETKELVQVLEQYERGESNEAKIVHDADVLALCLELKSLIELGNTNAVEWFTANKDRLRLKEAREIYTEIGEGNTQDWWKKERDQIHSSFLRTRESKKK